MQLLQRNYLNKRIQEHFDNLKLPQTETPVEHKDLVEALRNKGAIQPSEAPEEANIFPWPFTLKGDENDLLFLSHCNIRFFYFYQGDKWEKRQLCLTLGLFATYCCKNEDPNTLADEIIRIDTQLIPQWIEDFNNLHPLEMTDLAMSHFRDQCHKVRDQLIVLDTYAASVYGVSVTEVRQTISRNKSLFHDFAFHLTWEEHQAYYKNTLNPPKLRKSDYRPYALTFEAYSLLSMQLHSTIAIKVNMGIIKTVSSQVSIFELLKQIKQQS